MCLGRFVWCFPEGLSPLACIASQYQTTFPSLILAVHEGCQFVYICIKFLCNTQQKNGQLGVIGLHAVGLSYVDALVTAQVAMTLG